MRTQFTIPILPRHPLLRGLVLVAVVIALAGLITMGLVVGTLVFAVAAVVLGIRGWLSRHARRKGDPSVIEGEFTVVPPRPRQGLPYPE
jgi:hypothetical protein